MSPGSTTRGFVAGSGRYLILALGVFLFSCAAPPPAERERAPLANREPLPRYHLVFIIHGDGGYLYHDTEGNKYKADEEALAGAIKVAETNSDAEVFIFHQKHRRHFLLIFPRHDGEFYYYRNGQLLTKESYWRDKATSRFDPEVEFYNRFHVRERADPVRLFFYLGHEIPEFDGVGYDQSYRDRSFTTDELANCLKRMTPDSTRFDLVVLSTCFNGTPHTVKVLAPYARYIMASPGNLHLSYFDLQSFESLSTNLGDGDMRSFAGECARQSFDRLTQDIQTEISISVYDVDRVQDYLLSVDSLYDGTLSTLNNVSRPQVEHCDCADDSVYVRLGMERGVDVFFRSARFGRSAHKKSHSGWECLRLPNSSGY